MKQIFKASLKSFSLFLSHSLFAGAGISSKPDELLYRALFLGNSLESDLIVYTDPFSKFFEHLLYAGHCG